MSKLYSFRGTSALSKYGLLVLLVFSLVMAKLYIGHDVSHLLKPDTHCAFCTSVVFDNDALPVSMLELNHIYQPVLYISLNKVAFYSVLVFFL